jgi:hypothetical protein
VAIKHTFVSLVTDIGGPTYVQPTHWNQGHNTPPFRVFDWDPGASGASFGLPSTAGATFTEFPSGETYPVGRGGFDFTYVDTIQLGVNCASGHGYVVGASSALRFQYMASGFPGSWYSFDATGGSAPFVSMATGNNASLFLASANGLRLSASVAVSAAAKALPQPLTTRLAAAPMGNGSAVFLGKIVVFGS